MNSNNLIYNYSQSFAGWLFYYLYKLVIPITIIAIIPKNIIYFRIKEGK